MYVKNHHKSNGTGGYLDHLFENKSNETSTPSEPLIDSTRLRKDLSSSVYSKAEENKKKKFPYVYGPKLPQLDPRHLYSINSDTESINLTLVDHPNQPTIPNSIPKRDKRQTKDSTKIKGKLSSLNEKQDNLIHRTKTYNQIYPKDSEKKIYKDVNPIAKPVYKLWGKVTNDKDLQKGKKVSYVASAPKTPIWQRFSSSNDVKENMEGLGDVDADTHDVELNRTRSDEEIDADIRENMEGLSDDVKENMEGLSDDVKENMEGLGDVDADTHDIQLNKVRSNEEIDADIKENMEGLGDVDASTHDIQLNKVRSNEEIDADIKENIDGPDGSNLDTNALSAAEGAVENNKTAIVDTDALSAAEGAVEVENTELNDTFEANDVSKDIDQDALNAAEGAVEVDNITSNDQAVAKDTLENLDTPAMEAAEGAVENDDLDDVKSKVSYNPVFFINKKSNKKIQRQFEQPLQAVSSKFKSIINYKDKKSVINADNIKEVNDLQQQQDANAQKISALSDEIIDLQEQCQPLHFKKLDELERQNQLKKFHHKVDLYKHNQEKLQIQKKKIEKERRHKGREYNREMRSNIRKQRQLQKSKRDLKKEQLRSLRRHQRKVNHFNEMKKKFVTDVESKTFEAPEYADDESEDFIQPVQSVASKQDEVDASKDTIENEDKKNEDGKFTKEFIEPDTPEQYEEKINEIGKEFDFISNEPLISHEEEKELSKLKLEINAKKEEINKIAEKFNLNNETINSKLSVISDFKPPVENNSSALSNIKAPKLSTLKSINMDFSVPTDDEFVLSDPSVISTISEYQPAESSEESELSSEKISSSDIGSETDSEDEGTGIAEVPVGYKGVLPERGFLRSANHDSSAAKHFASAKVPSVYDSWVIKEGLGADNVPKGFKGVLPQNKFLDSVAFDKGNGVYMKQAKVPSVYDSWAIKEGLGADNVPKGFKGVLPQNKFLDSVAFDKGNGAYMKQAKVPEVYNTWKSKTDNLNSIKSNAFTEYSEEDIVTVPSGYKLNEKVL
ncbi:hypothetical protein ACO0R3_003455 [Hanseniaspora guilliermondii]